MKYPIYHPLANLTDEWLLEVYVVSTMQHPTSIPLRSGSLESTLACVTGVAAALALLSSEAEAAVQIFTPAAPIVVDTEADWGLSFDPMSNAYSVGNGIVDTGGEPLLFCLSTNFDGGAFMASWLSPVAMDVVTQVPEGEFTVAPIGAGEVIGSPTVGLESSAYFDFSNYNAGDKFFIGYGFKDQGSTDPHYYGWAEVSFAPDGDMTLYSWAYEDVAGESIITGAAIPETSSTALLAGGFALALCTRKRSRRGQA